jgi:hypothetical protein
MALGSLAGGERRADREPGMTRHEVENEVARGPICNYCDEKLAPKQAFCGKCGHPTEHANHDERVLWDLGQWEVSRRRKASVEPKDTRRASESADRTKELFRSAQDKAVRGVEPAATDANGNENGGNSGAEVPKRSFLGRPARRPAPQAPAARPAASKPAPKPAQAPARVEPARPAASTPARPPARPNDAVQPAASTGRHAPAARKAPTMTSERPSAAAPAPTARPVERREYVAPKAKAPAEAPPLIMIRKSAEEAPAPAASTTHAPEHRAPAKPSARAQRKAAEEKRLEADRARRLEQKEAERLRAEQRKEADRLRAEQKKEEERRRKEEAKGAQKRQRKHKRHSNRVNRRAAELDLRDGERVSLSIEGWSRFRRATMVVTNYRVALITQIPPQVRWIPLEEVSGVHHRWRGSQSLVVTSTIEILTLQKSKKQMLASFEQLLESEVAEARRPGATQRHHGDITQEWAERSTEIWDSHLRRLRLWIRRHPVITLGSLTVCVIATFLLTGLLTSFFSPTR